MYEPPAPSAHNVIASTTGHDSRRRKRLKGRWRERRLRTGMTSGDATRSCDAMSRRVSSRRTVVNPSRDVTDCSSDCPAIDEPVALSVRVDCRVVAQEHARTRSPIAVQRRCPAAVGFPCPPSAASPPRCLLSQGVRGSGRRPSSDVLPRECQESRISQTFVRRYTGFGWMPARTMQPCNPATSGHSADLSPPARARRESSPVAISLHHAARRCVWQRSVVPSQPQSRVRAAVRRSQ